ncbi:MAG: acyl-CoA dehydrogenase family protein [Candidatus Lernaella stagnicola]|nr:acyl-CoA dehydrogenase family protein [Candidatus Lernaella stagnicola]
MHFEINDDQRMLVDMVRDFADNELKAQAAEIDQTERFPLESIRKMSELGLMGINVPEEYGGSPMGAVALSLAITEVAKACASTAVTMSVTNMVAEAINAFGTEEQKRTFIPKVVSGEFPMGSFSLSEPGAGSDAAALRTKAVLDGDHWVLNGSKIFISHGAFCSVMVVWARTSDDPGPKGISAFLVEKDTPGLIVGKEEHKLGLRGSNTVALAFEDCRIPKDNLLGELGGGFKIAMMALDGGRIGISSQCIGIGAAAIAEAASYAKVREQFGKPLAKMQAIQWKLADMATNLEAARLLTLQAAWRKQSGLKFSREASMAKLFAAENLQDIVREAVQIHGGYGYTKEYLVERLMRDARVVTIYEGTSEVQRIVIARDLLAD